jgi:hypothetical protein
MHDMAKYVCIRNFYTDRTILPLHYRTEKKVGRLEIDKLDGSKSDFSNRVEESNSLIIKSCRE